MSLIVCITTQVRHYINAKSAPTISQPSEALKHFFICLAYLLPVLGMFCKLGPEELRRPLTVPPILKLPCRYHLPSSFSTLLLILRRFLVDALYLPNNAHTVGQF